MTLARSLAATLSIPLSLAPVLLLAASTRVVTVPIETVLETPRYDVPATVVVRDAPNVMAEISAAVVDVPVIVGDQVEPGDLLARLDCGRYEAQRDAARGALARAVAQQRFADRQLTRARDLRERKSISEELLDQRTTELAAGETDVQSARATLRQREIDVASCSLRAPLAGVITARHVSVGDYATPGSPIVDLTANAGQEVSVLLRPDQVTSFTAARNWVLVARDQTWPLALRTIVPVLDTVSRTQEARLTFRDAAALPGTPGRVTWSGQVAQIPSDFLVRRDGRLGVFVLDDEEARFVALPGAQEGRPAPNTLANGTLLIDEGRQRLSDGDRVLRSGHGAAGE